MNNKEFIDKYLEFKDYCTDREILDLKEVARLFEIKLRIEDKPLR